MRIRFVVLSVLIGCLALLLGLGTGRTENAAAPPAKRERAARPRPRVPAPVPVPAPAPPAGADTNWIDDRFRRLDRDGDGFLSPIEMTEDLRAELNKWDVNKDRLIDLAEWRAYVTAVLAHQRRLAADSKNGPRGLGKKPGKKLSQRPAWKPRAQNASLRPRVQGAAARPPFNEDRRTSPGGRRNKGTSSQVYKLPSNLPAWFKEYDADGDGQVALHEWQEKEDDDREFWKYDLNKDGFITLEELIRSGQFETNTDKVPPRAKLQRAALGEFFYFEVTGTTGGGLWGTDVYTFDSLISTAAVHAGVLRAGETGLVKVTVLSGQRQHLGTTRNGVTSGAFGPFHKSYRIEEAPH